MIPRKQIIMMVWFILIGWMEWTSAFSTKIHHHHTCIPTRTTLSSFYQQQQQQQQQQQRSTTTIATSSSCMVCYSNKNNHDSLTKEEQEEEERARLQILTSRRKQIRTVLKSAEQLRQIRLISQMNQPNTTTTDVGDNSSQRNDTRTAFTITAVVIAMGAVLLRMGGRAALISTVGLDFIQDNPELQTNMEQILQMSETMNPVIKLLVFTMAWTMVKCLCFDAGGIVLALASGILFGGVIQGAVLSALAATIGSSVAFGLAKLDTPIRQKALELLDEYPSLRGIEKVVAQDGLKAILTLRLAPILPIPLGMYNYIYGVTNVGWWPFCGGIFLGSLKPYLLDSYLGYFGKTLVDGSIGDDTTMQDTLLLVALGVSVLIGVFASQLATETWDAVVKEVEEEKKKNMLEKGNIDDVDDMEGIKREFLGWKVPEWLVGFQIALKEADERIRYTIVSEYNAKVWNYTNVDDIPMELNPALQPDSPERVYVNQGIDLTASFCDGLVLSPILFQSYWKYSDPLYKEEEDDDDVLFLLNQKKKKSKETINTSTGNTDEFMLRSRLQSIRSRALERIRLLDENRIE